MLFKFFNIFLIFLVIVLYVSHVNYRQEAIPSLASLSEDGSKEPLAIHNEYLVLFEQKYADQAEGVLSKLGFSIEGSAGEWLLIKRANAKQASIEQDKNLAEIDHKIVAMLENQPEIFAAAQNIFNRDDNFLCRHKKEPSDALLKELLVKDTLFKRQWYLAENPGINAIKAWDITKGSEKTLIGLVDRNFDLTQIDLNPEQCQSRRIHYKNMLEYLPQEMPKPKEQPVSHGSQVLAVLAPCTDNVTGISGVDWHAQVFAVDSKHDASLFARMFGVLWALGIDPRNKNLGQVPSQKNFKKNYHPAQIINASFGFSGGHLEDPPYAPVLDAIGEINRRGAVIVASAGNESMLADRRLPGAAGGVISVGGTDRHGKTASFSNFGRTIDVLAPSEDIISIENNEFSLVKGTSFSAPLVSAVVGLMVSVNQRLSFKAIEYILKKTAHPLSCEEYCPDSLENKVKNECLITCCINGKNTCSGGIIDAYAAVKTAQEGIPDAVLVDVDDYYLPLSEHERFKTTVRVKNWGRKAGQILAQTNDAHLKVSPATFEIAAASLDGSPSYQEVTIYYDKMPKKELAISLVFWSAANAEPSNFDDRIEAIVAVRPDHPTKPKKLKDLGL